MKTTLEQIKNLNPCKPGWETLLEYLGPDFPFNKEFPVTEIVKSNGIKDTFWLLKRTMEPEALKTLSVEFACDCAERVLPIYEAKYPQNKAPREAVAAARAWLKNPSAAAYAAAYAAADAAADAAAYAAYAADAAAYAAADDAAYAADAADAAEEKEWQGNRLVELLEELK